MRPDARGYLGVRCAARLALPGAAAPANGTAASRNASGERTSGSRMLAENGGCGSCHSIDGSSGVGPTWQGLYGSEVELTDGTTVTADDQCLIMSITHPDAQIVSGYQSGVMAAAVPAGSVSGADAAAIVAHIRSLSG